MLFRIMMTGILVDILVGRLCVRYEFKRFVFSISYNLYAKYYVLNIVIVFIL